MDGIGDGNGIDVFKYAGRFFKTNGVLAKIDLRFPIVPLEV